jgi:hypothetical protein
MADAQTADLADELTNIRPARRRRQLKKPKEVDWCARLFLPVSFACVALVGGLADRPDMLVFGVVGFGLSALVSLMVHAGIDF